MYITVQQAVNQQINLGFCLKMMIWCSKKYMQEKTEAIYGKIDYTEMDLRR
jgi:hypothetical protein